MAWCALAAFSLCQISAILSYCWVASAVPWTPSAFLIGFNSGVISAQAGLLAIYGVLGPQRAWVRQAVALVIGMILALLWAVGHLLAVWIEGGVANAFPGRHTDEVFASMLPLPALFFAACAPLWFFRTLFRWRIERADVPAKRLPELSIAGILIATLIVALSLGLVRLGSHLADDYDDSDFWIGTGIGCAFSVGISLFMLPFCAWAILRTRVLLAGTVAAACWPPLLCLSLICVISAVGDSWPDPYDWLQFVCVTTGFSLFLLGPLIAVRFLGYRLQIGIKGSLEK